MRIENGKVIISKKDLDKRVVVIKNHNSETELQAARFSAMQAIPGCIAIPLDKFRKYNDFRYDNKYDTLSLEEVMVVDVRAAEQEHNFEKLSEKNKSETSEEKRN